MPCRACVHLSACIDSDMLSDMHNHQTSSAVDRAARRTGMSYHAMQPRPGSSTGKPQSLRSSRVTVWTEHLPPSKRCRRNRVQEAREKARPGALCTESPSWSEASGVRRGVRQQDQCWKYHYPSEAVWTDMAILGGWTSAKSASCWLHLGELAALKPMALVEESGHPGEAHPGL